MGEVYVDLSRAQPQLLTTELAATGGSLHRSLLKCLDACFGEMPELADDGERYMALKKSGGCCPR